MKSLLFAILPLFVFLCCCTGNKYDSRLLHSDSLMNSNPDSAYKVLRNINIGNLAEVYVTGHIMLYYIHRRNIKMSILFAQIH